MGNGPGLGPNRRLLAHRVPLLCPEDVISLLEGTVVEVGVVVVPFHQRDTTWLKLHPR